MLIEEGVFLWFWIEPVASTDSAPKIVGANRWGRGQGLAWGPYIKWNFQFSETIVPSGGDEVMSEELNQM